MNWQKLAILTACTSLSACFKTPVTSQGSVTTLLGDASYAGSSPVSEIKNLSSFDPNATVAQQLAPPPVAELQGSSVTMAPGSLGISASLVFEQAANFAETSIAAEVGLTGDIEVSSTSAGMIIRPTENVDLKKPLTIAMPLPSVVGLRLAEGEGSRYGIFYKYFDPTDNRLMTGFKVVDGESVKIVFDEASGRDTIVFEGYFGAYWAAQMSREIKKVDVPAPVQATEPVINFAKVSVIESKGVVNETDIAAKQEIADIVWEKPTLALNAETRVVSVKASINKERTVKNCKVDLFENTAATKGHTVEAPEGLSQDVNVDKPEVHSVYGRFRCQDDQDRISLSPWSDVLALPLLPQLQVLSISSSAKAGYYQAGALIPVSVQFSDKVTVKNATEVNLLLNASDAGRPAFYVSGSGSDTLLFHYTVAAGDATGALDLKDANALRLGTAGQIIGSARNPAATDLSAFAKGAISTQQKNISIDTTAPQLPSNVGFGNSASNTTSVQVSWSGGFDTNLKTYQAKLCRNADCSTDCLTAVASLQPPVTLQGVTGNSYFACVKAEDHAGFQTAFVPSLTPISIDTSVPTVVSVSSTNANGHYKAGQNLSIQVKFSQNVFLTGNSLNLLLGGLAGGRSAAYASGSGSDTLNFSYLVQNGDTTADLNYIDSNSLVSVAGSSLRNALGTAAALTLPAPSNTKSLGAQKAIVIDTTAPGAPSAISFAGGSTSSSTSLVLNWTPGSDTNFRRSLAKICLNQGCDVSCSVAAEVTGNSTTLLGANGSSYFGCVQSEDQAGQFSAFVASASPIAISTSVPSVIQVSSNTNNGAYGVGQALQLTVTFSEIVNVLQGNDITLKLETGSLDRDATYKSGSGSSTLVFDYLIQSGDTSADLEYLSTSALSLGIGGSIKNGAGTIANLALPALGSASSLGGSRSLQIDTTAPSAPFNVIFGSGSGSIPLSWAAGSEPDRSHFEVLTCTDSACSTGCVSHGTPSTSSTSITTPTQTVFACVKAIDFAGNASSYGISSPYNTDTTPPTIVSIDASVAPSSFSSPGQSFNIRIHTSEPVFISNLANVKALVETGITDRQLDLVGDNGTTTLIFPYTVVSGDETPSLNVLSLLLGGSTIQDQAGNNLITSVPTPGAPGSLSFSGNIYKVDTLPPSPPSNISYSNNPTLSLNFSATWNPGADIDPTQSVLKLCPDSGCVSGCGTEQTEAPAISSTSITAAGAGSYFLCVKSRDAFGHDSNFVSGPALTVNSGAPFVQSVSALDANGFYKAGDILSIVVNFNAAVNYTNAANISLQLETGATDRQAFLTSGNGTAQLTFSYTVQAGDTSSDLDVSSSSALQLGAGTIKSLANVDAILSLPPPGSGSSLSGLKAIGIDTTPPSSPSSINFASVNATSNPNILVHFNPGTDTNLQEHQVKLCLSPACTSGCQATSTGVSSPLSATGASDGFYYACVSAVDAAGNVAGPFASSPSVNLDRVAPNVTTVTADQPTSHAFVTGQNVIIDVNFDEPVIVGGSPVLHMNTSPGSTAALAQQNPSQLRFMYNVIPGYFATSFNYDGPGALQGATITDEAGNSWSNILPSPGLTPYNYSLDSVPPSPPAAIAFNSSVETVPQAQLNWTDTSGGEPGISFEAKLCDSQACNGSCLAPVNVPGSPRLFTGLSDGIYYGCVASRDSFGNLSNFVGGPSPVQIQTIPNFNGVSNAEIMGSFGPFDALVHFQLQNVPTGPIQKYRILFREAGGSFIQIAEVMRGDSQFDPNPNDDILEVAIAHQMIRDGEWKIYAVDPGNNEFPNGGITSIVPVLKGHPNYILVPPGVSGLAYDYYIMRYEASLSPAGIIGSNNIVSQTLNDMGACNYEFHANAVANHSSCGPKDITKEAESNPGLQPARDISWDAAYYACRNASDGDAIVRMPTMEEWRRASATPANNLGELTTITESNGTQNCNVLMGNALNTGDRQFCKSFIGAFDMAGNVREWVDMRMMNVNTNSTSRDRFGFSTTIGEIVPNGIDNQSFVVEEVPTMNTTMAMAMGADYMSTGIPGFKKFGEWAQSWRPTGAIEPQTGFRCVGFRSNQRPSQQQLALPADPKWQIGDASVTPAFREMPDNLHAGAKRLESIRIVTQNIGSSTAQGEVHLNWIPWSKTVCNPSCSTTMPGMNYKIYRFKEPNRINIRPATPWTGAGSGYPTERPLDPLLVDPTSNARIFLDQTSPGGGVIATVTGCSQGSVNLCQFIDSVSAGTNFDPMEMYYYMIVPFENFGGGRTTEVVPMVQRYRSPHVIGDAFITGSAAFRFEPRYRRASVFAVHDGYQDVAQEQTMRLVPMDMSGLDHDFYIHRYESAENVGTFAPNSPTDGARLPFQADPSGVWLPNASTCYEKHLLFGNLDPGPCGVGGTLNNTNSQMRSRAGIHGSTGGDQGSFVKACQNTRLIATGGREFFMHLSTDSEWFKAADFGDTDQNGSIDINLENPGQQGLNISSLISGSPDASTVRCHTDNDPPNLLVSGSPDTANCMSRYGVMNMVGNLAEFTLNQSYGNMGLDNGIDGLNFGPGVQDIFGSSQIDLLRGMFKPLGTQSYPTGSLGVNDSASSSGGFNAHVRGGSFNSNSAAGPLHIKYPPPTQVGTQFGGRCAL